MFSCGWSEAGLVGLRQSLLELDARLAPKASAECIRERYRCIAVDEGGLRSSLQGQPWISDGSSEEQGEWRGNYLLRQTLTTVEEWIAKFVTSD